MRQSKNEQGVTLIETVIAAAIIALVMVGVAPLFIYATHMTADAQLMTAAVDAATREFEALEALAREVDLGQIDSTNSNIPLTCVTRGGQSESFVDANGDGAYDASDGDRLTGVWLEVRIADDGASSPVDLTSLYERYNTHDIYEMTDEMNASLGDPYQLTWDQDTTDLTGARAMVWDAMGEDMSFIKIVSIRARWQVPGGRQHVADFVRYITREG